MKPNISDQLIIDWCRENGWEYPSKIDGEWWAIAPGEYVPKPLPSERQLNLIIQSLASGLDVAFRHLADSIANVVGAYSREANFTIADLFSHINVSTVNWDEVLRKFPQTLPSPKANASTPRSIQPITEPPPPSLKELAKRNKKMMRDFLESKYK
jgi:hypothetical protein